MLVNLVNQVGQLGHLTELGFHVGGKQVGQMG